MSKKPSKNFVIAAGGTGMRCLQSFLNMCAMGMYEAESVDILLLETDIENGDKKNSENLVSWYNTLCTEKAGAFDYFGPQINFYTFIPDYSQDNKRRFTLISRVEEGNSETNRMLTNLFYEEAVQEFDLMHGFRAQTHVGTYLMYHAIIEEIREAVAKDVVRGKSQMYKFVNAIKEQNTVGEARVFLLGSTFGGTGASSIPVMARAISDSAKILTGGSIKMENIFFGAVILTPYFTFGSPSKEQKKSAGVIADSQFFAHNSAATLMYYIKDTTVSKTYKRFYFLGWPFASIDMDEYKKMITNAGETTGKTITGGKSQENPAHPNELIAAFSAKHFFEQTPKDWFKDIYTTDIRFKAIEYESGGEGKDKEAFLHFEDMISGEAKSTKIDGGKDNQDSIKKKSLAEIFGKNMTGLYYFSLLIQEIYSGDITAFLSNLKRYNYSYSFTDEELDALSRYTQYFAYKPDGENIKPGWLPQMFYSLKAPKGEQFFNYNGQAFDVLKVREGAVMPKHLLFEEFMKAEGNKKQGDVFISAWTKYNKPLKSGKKNEFFHDLRNVFSNLNVAKWVDLVKVK